MKLTSIFSMFYLTNHILRSYAFCPVVKRGYSNSTILMRAKKRKGDFAVEDSYLSNYNKRNVPRYKPRTENQHSYVQYLNDWNIPIVLGIGPAGCGKTMFACLQAIQELRNGNIDKIVLTRPIVSVEEEELGFLPGNLVKKMDPWTRPVFDIFSEFYQQRDIENMIHCGILEISPLAYMRGRTFKRSFIIADEMQNSTPNQMMMLTTRIGEHSKMVITGDLKQSDRSVDNGLLDLIEKLDIYKKKNINRINDDNISIEIVKMITTDVQRSKIVSQILDVYNVNSDMAYDECHSADDITYDDCNMDDDIDSTESNVIDETLRKIDSIDKNIASNDAAMIPLHQMPKNKKI